jgi:hypothetical protein
MAESVDPDEGAELQVRLSGPDRAEHDIANSGR